MVRPLDHVTVIQQINFAEKFHQNQQVHPEVSKLQAEIIDKEKRSAEKKRTQALEKSERTRIHLRKEGRGAQGRGDRSSGKKRKGRGIDLRA
jgi:hypothetical protein